MADKTYKLVSKKFEKGVYDDRIYKNKHVVCTCRGYKTAKYILKLLNEDLKKQEAQQDSSVDLS